MKRYNNLYDQITSMENLILASTNAQKGKLKQYGVVTFNKNKEQNLIVLQDSLNAGSYVTSAYSTFIIREPKERIVSKLPFFPDRIVHHAIMNVMEPIFNSLFTADTYSCIKGKGIHKAVNNLKNVLKNPLSTKYCLKLDIKKFYPSVDHEVLKNLLLRKLKDRRLINLLFEIIDSSDGLPIGNYLSQYFANFYMTPFDHWIKEKMGVVNYFRYLDDIIILSGSKEHLQHLLGEIKKYLTVNLKLTVKGNYQVFSVDERGIDFLGYVFRHTHVLLRKTIKKNFARKISKGANAATIASYKGWAKHANTKHLLKKLLNEKI